LKIQLQKEQVMNETAKQRCVGLVIETRPDFISEDELKWLRYLGVTKIQLGVQTLDDAVLKLNKRGHTAKQSITAADTIRLAGFKIHAHWMTNLYGSNPTNDYKDFQHMFREGSIQPDELKIYPCLLLEGTELFEVYKKGKYHPYTEKEMLELLIKCKVYIKPYCRITRLFRDIPSFEIARGIKKTNFREIVQKEIKKRKLKCKCIRCREIRKGRFIKSEIRLSDLEYKTIVSTEHFISFNTNENKIIGFLRLSLPKKKLSGRHFIKELQNSAIIREVHVYGVSQRISEKDQALSQHRGIGKKLLNKAEELAKKNGFQKVSVISAIGTRRYYSKLGYSLGKLYMSKDLR
jgi:elongator complex protein 3